MIPCAVGILITKKRCVFFQDYITSSLRYWKLLPNLSFAPLPTTAWSKKRLKTDLSALMEISLPISNNCTRWRGSLKGSRRMGNGRNFLKTSEPYSLIKTYRQIPLSARSISLTGSFRAAKFLKRMLLLSLILRKNFSSLAIKEFFFVAFETTGECQ